MPDHDKSYHQTDLNVTHDGERYQVPAHKVVNCTSDFWKWQASGERQSWPKWVDNETHPAPPQRVNGDAVSTTWIGHATVLVQTGGVNILTDPFFSLRASPIQFAGPKRVRHPGIALKDLPPIDLVLLSHNHYDHMDLPALRKLVRHHQASIITPHGNARIVNRWIRQAGVIELGWHETFEHSPGVLITPTPALHWSKRTFGDRNKALWSAFMIEAGGRKIYFGGDTGFGTGTHFAQTKNLYGAPDLALLPIGAYEPRWFMKTQHMNPDEAAQAHKMLGAKASLAIHHATIQLTDEAIDAPAKALQAARLTHGIRDDEFAALGVGETWAVSPATAARQRVDGLAKA
ncbi:MAG: MBL fold metallo-hydrolase [Anderseniella sp.]